MTDWVDMQRVIPEGKQGTAAISHFTVTEEDEKTSATRAMVTGDRNAFIRRGKYVRLLVHGEVMMSDTPMERHSNWGVVSYAKGHVLMAGLGVGMIIPPLFENDLVTKVTVIEKNPDVIALVEKPLRVHLGESRSLRLKIIEADIFEWTPDPGIKFDTVYFDIWPDICLDNLDEMTKLHRRFCRRKSRGAWMGSWQHDYLKYLKNSGRLR